LGVGDTLFSNLFSAEGGGPLSQNLNQVTTFTVGPGVGSFLGRAVWEIGGGLSGEPLLGPLNIQVLQGATVIADDAHNQVNNGFVTSTFDLTGISPGTYTLVATGNGHNAPASLDISLTFAQAVPEAGTFSMLLAGFGVLGLLMRRRLTMAS
jgi:hypothetical protein